MTTTYHYSPNMGCPRIRIISNERCFHGNSRSRSITSGYISSAFDKSFIDRCACHYSAIAAGHLQNTQARNTGLSSTDELAAQHNVPSKRGRSRPQAVLSRSTQATNCVSVKLLRDPDDTLSFLHGKQRWKLTHSHQLHRILILMRSLHSLHAMMTKAPHRLTHTLAYAVI